MSSCLEIAGAHAEDPTGFARKCQNILDLVIADLASNAHIFMNAVDPKDVPDYYNIVKTPMDLTTIKNKLAAGAYSKGTEFADVSTHWGNAFAGFFKCFLVGGSLSLNTSWVLGECFVQHLSVMPHFSLILYLTAKGLNIDSSVVPEKQACCNSKIARLSSQTASNTKHALYHDNLRNCSPNVLLITMKLPWSIPLGIWDEGLCTQYSLCCAWFRKAVVFMRIRLDSGLYQNLFKLLCQWLSAFFMPEGL